MGTAPVSYTHLDVSKRQPYAVSYIIDDGKETSTASVDINSCLLYTSDTHIKDLFIKPLHIMKVQASALFWAGGFYVLWNILSQIGLSMVLKPFIKESDSLEQALLTLVQQGADHMETIWLLLAFCIVYFLVQYVYLSLIHI